MSEQVAQTVRLSVNRLLGAVVVALVVAGGLAAIAIARWSPGPEGWRGYSVGLVAMIVASLASIVPMALGARFGVMGVVGGFFGGSFVRAAVAIGLCMGTIGLWKVAPQPTLLTMAALYLAVLAAETTVVAKALWNQPMR